MSEELLYWQALNRAMDAELAADSSVFTLGEDVGLYGGSYRVTEGLYAKYGEWRIRDTPISENSFTGLGVGAALVGLRPVVEIMTINFMLLALDSIINAAAKIPFMSGGQFSMPLVVRVPGGVAHQLQVEGLVAQDDGGAAVGGMVLVGLGLVGGGAGQGGGADAGAHAQPDGSGQGDQQRDDQDLEPAHGGLS